MPKEKPFYPLKWLSKACNTKSERGFCRFVYQDGGFVWGTDGHRLHIYHDYIKDENGESLDFGFYDKEGNRISNAISPPTNSIKKLIPDDFLAFPAKIPNFESCERRPLPKEIYKGYRTKGDAIKISGYWFAEMYVKEALKGMTFKNSEPELCVVVEGRFIQLRIDNKEHKLTAVIMGCFFND